VENSINVENSNTYILMEKLTSKQESIETLNYYLEERGCEPLSEKELIDWNIVGGETDSELQSMVNDYVSELHTNECENKNAYRYEL
jgi:protein gp37